MKKTKKTPKIYNPNDVGVKNGNLYGLAESWEERKVACIPVPWELTTSYGRGAAKAPKKILAASTQLDLCDANSLEAWKYAPGMTPRLKGVAFKSKFWSPLVRWYLFLIEYIGWTLKPHGRFNLDELNLICRWMCDQVKKRATKLIELGKIPAVIGGDHSTALGLIEALNDQAQKEQNSFGVLVFDSHLDLRECYEGFDYSHASVFYNAAQLSNVESFTFVASRDFCDEEIQFANGKIKPMALFTDKDLFERKANGEKWNEITENILFSLPKEVYLSFDIDALERQFCPKTGTPVPGGISWNEALYVINRLQESGRKIIGFDVNETGNSQWDASVAARLVFELGKAAVKSQS